MKKIVSVLLLAVMLLGTVSVAVSAETLKSTIMINSSFYDKNGTAGLVAKVAVLLGDRKEYRVSNCSICGRRVC